MKTYFNKQRKTCGLVSVCCIILCFGGGQKIKAQEPITLTHDLGSSGQLTIDPVLHNGYDFLVTDNSATPFVVIDTPAITIKSGYTGTVTLKDVTITNNTVDHNAMLIEGNTKVTLKLMGTNTLTNTNNIPSGVRAVLKIATTTDLTIESYNGNDADGKLSVVQGQQSYSAALGTNTHDGAQPGETSGRVTINSGTIYTQGGDDGAGIGGGSQCAGGYITINGGDVTAVCDSRKGGANSGAGIGSGYNCSSNETYIRINGGTVTAVSLLRDGNTLCGSAIGAGNRASTSSSYGGFGYIIIAGGKIKASVRGYFDNADPCSTGECMPTGGTSGSEYGDHNNPAGSLNGVDGVGIGGGANPDANGTIIILPSADISEVYGGATISGGGDCWDIGNCKNIFYLNKKKLRVGVGASGNPKQTKVFTARTEPAQAGADILADIKIANEYLPAVASKAGTTGGTYNIVGAASGSTDALYYYTNSDVTFFTQAKTSNNEPFALYNAPTATSFIDLNTSATYNSGTNVYNVILNTLSPPTYDIKLSTGYTPGTLPLPPIDQNNITLNFGEATYSRERIQPGSGYKDTLIFQIRNEGAEWLDIKMDSTSTVESFVLTGPVVSPPEVENGAHLPVSKEGKIIASVKPRLAVGDHEEKLVLKAISAGGDTVTRIVTLKIKVEQQKVTGETSATLKATRPELVSPATKTNSEKVTLKARAAATDIDGVKTVWYQISADQVRPNIDAGVAAGAVPDTTIPMDAAWTRVDAQLNSNGKYSYSWTLKPDFPPKDTVYYIHWYMETVNTIGSYGTISSYDVKRKRPTPTIVKSDGVASIGAAPFEVTVTFDPAFDPAITPLAENMFIVSGGNIVLGSLDTLTSGKEYKLTVQSSNANNVTIRFPENRVTDAYGNRNAASIAPYTTLPFSNGLPLADFSSYTDSVYFAAPASVKFRVTSGNPDARLYRNDGSPVDNVNAAPAVEVTKDGASFSLTSVGFVDLDGTNQINEYTLTGAFTEGEYRIHIKGDSITNYVGNGIRDTVYTFRVFDLGLSFSGGTHDFGTLHEGYAPVAPYSVQVINNGSVTATGLSVVLGVGDTAYVMHTGAMTPTLAGGATTPFTIAPKTGLQVDTPTVGNQVFTATVTLMYHDRPVPGATFGVKFEVFKLQAPVAQIDYINETLTGLESGESYSINRETPVGVADDEIIPIAEGWMNGRTSTNEQIDPATGGRSIPQPIVIPLRPAAPAGVSKQDAGEGELNNGEILGVNDLMEYRLMPSETWIPVPAGNRALADLVPGTYQVRYKAIVDQAFSSHILTVVIQTQTIQRIEREILLPGMQGVTTLPLPGFHYVHSGEDFTFTLLFTGEPPKVKTSRIVEGVQEELTGVPDGAGGYTYTIRQVRESISVLFETGPVGNASVDGRAVWANAGQICIRTLHPEAADIHTVTGALFKRIRTAEGAEVSVPAAGGVYLIRFANGEVHKVIVR